MNLGSGGSRREEGPAWTVIPSQWQRPGRIPTCAALMGKKTGSGADVILKRDYLREEKKKKRDEGNKGIPSR